MVQAWQHNLANAGLSAELCTTQQCWTHCLRLLPLKMRLAARAWGNAIRLRKLLHPSPCESSRDLLQLIALVELAPQQRSRESGLLDRERTDWAESAEQRPIVHPRGVT